jgi:hypothetical protein
MKAFFEDQFLIRNKENIEKISLLVQENVEKTKKIQSLERKLFSIGNGIY